MLGVFVKVMWNVRVLSIVLLWLTNGRSWASDSERLTFFLDDHPDGFHHTHDLQHYNVTAAVHNREIPLELLKELSDVSNLNDFLSNFVDQNSIKNGTQTAEPDILSNRFGADDERKSAQTPKQAGCVPEQKVVPLRSSDDPALFFYPFCTRVERCGGCCASAVLSCQPSQTEIVNYKVVVTEYKGGKQMQFKAMEIIPVERHTKCKCDCIVKEKDCNQYQEYRKDECRCVCLNVDEQQKCLNENETKIWDPSMCTCECRDTKECSTGFYFDQNSCSCAQIPKVRSRSPLQVRQLRRQPNQSYLVRRGNSIIGN